MQITRLKVTKRGDRVNVYIDDKFAFSIAQKLVADFALYKGQELSEKKIGKLREEDVKTRYFDRVLNLIARRPRSEFEVQSYLKRKLYKETDSEKYINNIISILKEKNYLDDFEFAKWWVENRMRFRPRGKYLVKQELKGKGIKDSIIEEAFKKQGFTRTSEFGLALELGKKKKRLLRGLTDARDKKKFIDFLLRKGFSYDIAIKVLKRLG